MPEIIISQKSSDGQGWIFEVRVKEENGETVHEVAVPKGYYGALAAGKESPEDLTRRSFEFLLEREPKESILGRFELPLIQKYFPEYEKTISAPQPQVK